LVLVYLSGTGSPR